MNEFIIVFHDKSTKWITTDQALGLSKAMDDPTLFNKYQNIGTAKIALSSIAKILSKKEYSEQYPNREIGRVFKNQFKQLEEPQGNFNHKKAMAQMRKAYKIHVLDT